ncbi:MAG: DegV family protein [Lachnospiraceae bacterium]
MSKIKIIADSTCDLSKELLDKYNIDLIPLYIVMDEVSYMDGIEVTPSELYAWSDRVNQTPKTAAPGIEIATKIIKKYDTPNTDIIFLGISETMSTTCNVIRLIAKECQHAVVHVINSKNLSTGIGLQVICAAKMAQEGETAASIVTTIEKKRDLVSASFVVDTLTYLHRGGRCNAATALVAGALKLKPKIIVENGQMDVSKKYRGTIRNVVEKYVKDMEPALLNAENEQVFITHSGCSDEILEMVKMQLERLDYFQEILVTRAGGVISSHCGPNTLGVLFYRKD